MKLRIKGNSIRLRLTQTEAARLGEGKSVEETTQFSPTTKLSFIIQPAANHTLIEAAFENNQLKICIPASTLSEWANNNETGIEREQPIGNGDTLRLLIEKDFACLKPRAGEDESDTYANPMQGQAC
jgi:hypothetical protein